MQSTLRLSPAPRVAWLILVLALVVTALVAIAVGSRPKLPAPFGPASAGAYVLSRGGDIYRFDPKTATTSLLIGGPAFDFGPLFSHDGTHFAFLRGDVAPGDAGPLTVMVADADGGHLRALTAPSPDWADWSPDDRRIALMAGGDLYVVDADGSSAARKLPMGGNVHFPTWLPPDGKEILVRLEAPVPAILAIRPDGTGLRTVSQRLAVNETDFGSLAVSPDGTQVSFDRWLPPSPSADPIPRVVVMDIATGAETVLPTPDGTGQQATAVFSPDGRTVAYTRTYPNGTYQAVVAAADGSDAGRVLGTRVMGGPDLGLTKAFTPDGTALIARYGSDDAGRTFLLPLDGSAVTEVDSGAFDFLDIQRLAP